MSLKTLSVKLDSGAQHQIHRTFCIYALFLTRGVNHALKKKMHLGTDSAVMLLLVFRYRIGIGVLTVITHAQSLCVQGKVEAIASATEEH